MARYHSPWEPEEIKTLTDMKKEGYEYKDIADVLDGRTLRAVKVKAERLGLCRLTGPKWIMNQINGNSK